MRKLLTIVTIILMISFVCQGQSKTSEYIFLNAEQLKSIGINLSEGNLFYLNCHPVLERTGRSNDLLSLFQSSGPCLSIHFNDSIWGWNRWYSAEKVESLSIEYEVTTHNFFPQVITTSKGCRLGGRTDISERRIPIAIPLSEINVTGWTDTDWTDTIIFWFTLTDPLIRALPKDIIWRDYLKVPDIDTACRLPITITHPQFPGGDDARLRYLQDNMRYPAKARVSGIQGTVFITFVVERDGSITDVRILRGIGGGCDEEAIRVVKNMPKWIPGQIRGNAIRVQFNMPLRFTLSG